MRSRRRDLEDKTADEDRRGQLAPLLLFDGVEEIGADLGLHRDLLEGEPRNQSMVAEKGARVSDQIGRRPQAGEGGVHLWPFAIVVGGRGGEIGCGVGDPHEGLVDPLEELVAFVGCRGVSRSPANSRAKRLRRVW